MDTSSAVVEVSTWRAAGVRARSCLMSPGHQVSRSKSEPGGARAIYSQGGGGRGAEGGRSQGGPAGRSQSRRGRRGLHIPTSPLPDPSASDDLTAFHPCDVSRVLCRGLVLNCELVSP